MPTPPKRTPPAAAAPTPNPTPPAAKNGLGCLPSLPDPRDHLFAVPGRVLTDLPPLVDLRADSPAIVNQGTLNSCVANAVATAVEFDQMKQGISDVFLPSRLFLYYNARLEQDGVVSGDHGTNIVSAMQALRQYGDLPETDWQYVEDRVDDPPPQSAYDEAIQHQFVSYQRVDQSVAQMRGCLAMGYPFVFGFSLFRSFYVADSDNGLVPMPLASSDDSRVGGHCMMAVGYYDDKRLFICQNSWGTDNKGDNGYYYLPYEYLTRGDLTFELWTIRAVQ